MKRIVLFIIILLSICWLQCEPEYSERYLYIAVVGEYGIPFTGSYGDQYKQHNTQSRTPDYYYFHLESVDNHFIGEFHKSVSQTKDFRCLTVRLYIKEFPEPASLLVQVSQEHPESTIVVTYHD